MATDESESNENMIKLNANLPLEPPTSQNIESSNIKNDEEKHDESEKNTISKKSSGSSSSRPTKQLSIKDDNNIMAKNKQKLKQTSSSMSSSSSSSSSSPPSSTGSNHSLSASKSNAITNNKKKTTTATAAATDDASIRLTKHPNGSRNSSLRITSTSTTTANNSNTRRSFHETLNRLFEAFRYPFAARSSARRRQQQLQQTAQGGKSSQRRRQSSNASSSYHYQQSTKLAAVTASTTNNNNNNSSSKNSSSICQLCMIECGSSPKKEDETNKIENSTAAAANFMHSIGTCEHSFCMNCLRLYLKYQIVESRVSINCPQCDEKLHPNEIYKILSHEIKYPKETEINVNEVDDNDEQHQQSATTVFCKTKEEADEQMKNWRNLICKYEEFMVRRVLVTIPDIRFCPAPDCSFAVIASGCANCPQLTCQRENCNTSFCYHCKQHWHPNLTCEDAAIRKCINDAADLNSQKVRFNNNSNNSNSSIFRTFLQRTNSHISLTSLNRATGATNASSAAATTSSASASATTTTKNFIVGNSSLVDSLVKDEIKGCPRCQALIVKMDDGSCNHITCSVCGCEFCWLCMKEISDLHYLSPSGCTFWGKKPWSRKKKILWQLGTLVGAPIGIALIAGVAIPAIVIGLPIWSGRKVYMRYKSIGKHKRNLIVLGTVVGTVIIAPFVAALAVGIGVPILLAYVYGVVPISLCRSGGCGVTANPSGGVRFAFDDENNSDYNNNTLNLFSTTLNNLNNDFNLNNNNNNHNQNELRGGGSKKKSKNKFKINKLQTTTITTTAADVSVTADSAIGSLAAATTAAAATTNSPASHISKLNSNEIRKKAEKSIGLWSSSLKKSPTNNDKLQPPSDAVCGSVELSSPSSSDFRDQNRLLQHQQSQQQKQQHLEIAGTALKNCFPTATTASVGESSNFYDNDDLDDDQQSKNNSIDIFIHGKYMKTTINQSSSLKNNNSFSHHSSASSADHLIPSIHPPPSPPAITNLSSLFNCNFSDSAMAAVASVVAASAADADMKSQHLNNTNQEITITET